MNNYSIKKERILRIPKKTELTSFSTEEEIKKFYSNEDVQEALYLASPQLYDKCVKWINGTIKEDENEKIVFSLLKYAIRMCNRPTPFGLFAGCGIVNSHTVVISEDNFYRKTRLDMSYVCELIQCLCKKSHIKNNLNYYCNSSLYRSGNKYRYVEYHYENNKRIHKINSVDFSEYLEIILNTANDGANIYSLAQSITDNEISYEEAEAFIFILIDNQILVSELDPGVTGDDLLNDLIHKLNQIDQLNPNKLIKNEIKVLKKLMNLLFGLDNQIGNDIKCYEDVLSIIEELGVPFDESKLFQTDLFFNHKNDSSDNVEDQLIDNELKNVVSVLNKLTPRLEMPNIKKFKEKFVERYEEKIVPLIEALDPESGIGYASIDTFSSEINELIDDIPILQNLNSTNNSNLFNLKWSEKDSFILKKLIEAKEKNAKEINISIEELEKFSSNWDDLPITMSILYSYIGLEDNKPLLSIEHIGGTSANNLISRFSNGNDEIFELTKEISKLEQLHHPNKIVASILHLPESRMGNILYRKATRKFEIQYLSNTSVEAKYKLTPSDLLIAVKNDKIILYSPKHKSEIIPRLDNAHNYSRNSLPIYHFLSDLQGQNTRTGLFFGWGFLQSQFTYVPRVRIGNAIVERAKWNITKNDYKELVNSNNVIESIKFWRIKFNIPEIIVLVYGDNELIIDLTNELNIKMFINELKKYDFIELKEHLMPKSTNQIKDSNGNKYSNQFISILEKSLPKFIEEKNDLTTNDFTENDLNIPQRSFIIGSEWVFFKLYTGANTADKILTECIFPLMNNFSNNLITNWFYIRYVDTNMHLRLRIHLKDRNNIGVLIDKFYYAIKPYIDIQAIHNLKVDTYNREIERYGSSTIEFCEKIFGIDSVEILKFLCSNPDQKSKWLYSIKSVDELLTCFNYTLEQKISLLNHLQYSFGKEFGVNKRSKESLKKKYRIYRNQIDQVLIEGFLQSNNINYEIKTIVNDILLCHKKGDLNTTLDDLLASLIHMKMNRLFRSKQRVYELVIYYFMWKSYESILARVQKELI